ncbi:DUF3027 domain-containing protein [Galbitalea sp. SE-J8]|uniref:DUF3027 domain-containing protein n=1 Tax=Galbitalea sp. SE-J8 TaxID=3054952 RepID=UPI00259CFDE4|nr:DUF3027 domain-containing protein [Galbitalea sp. SE-J8]MDM4763730.1 DUF3027 domain-containing protein [Galbitalea sp. SE-J8]
MPDSTGADAALAELARSAALEIAPAASVGDLVDTIDEGENVLSLQFDCLLPGYPGWRWTVSVARLEGLEPSVLEAELLPAEGALLAPDWVPWSERLAEWKAAQEEAALAAAEDEPVEELDEGDADADGDDELDADDFDEDDADDESPRRTHGGDLDGVDIDEVIDDDPGEGE